jgi:ribosomal protein S18 acetylase RimI-like enzyme
MDSMVGSADERALRISVRLAYVDSQEVTVLDNPLWSSLSTRHRDLALGTGGVLRYPALVAPFLAVERAGPVSGAALGVLLAPGETVYLVGPRPPEAPAGFRLTELGVILQLVCDAALTELDGPPIVSLSEHRGEVLALTALVYPHFFRPRTMDLGPYQGIVEGGRLSAMIGERMGFPGHRELSAICTHPEASGRGLARRLLAHATNELLERQERPFLHVSPDNARALQLYLQNGYRVRAELPFASLHRL